MYEAFRIIQLHNRSGKDLLHLDFLNAPGGMAVVLHPERTTPQTIESRILGEPIEVDEAIAEEHFTAQQLLKRLIEPLAPDDIFVVEVSGQDTYAMSRRQFETTFPNVVTSRAYSEYGSYNYKDTPHRASAFIVR